MLNAIDRPRSIVSSQVASTKRFIENEDIPLLAIDGIVGGDMKLRPKPSRDGVEFLLEKWQCRDPRQAMIVGDHPMDMEVDVICYRLSLPSSCCWCSGW